MPLTVLTRKKRFERERNNKQQRTPTAALNIPHSVVHHANASAKCLILSGSIQLNMNSKELEKTAKYLFNKGLDLYKLGRNKEALLVLEKAENINLKFKMPEISCAKGLILDDFELYQEAVNSFEKAENDSPEFKFPDASYFKGLVLTKLNKNEEAISAYEKAENDSPGGKYLKATNNRALSLDLLGRFEEALVAFEKAENDSDLYKNPQASYNKGKTLIHLNRLQEAIDAFEKAENDSPNQTHHEASHDKGVALKSLGRYDESIAAFEKAEKDHPNCEFPEATIGKGIVLNHLEKYEEAILEFEKAETISPKGICPEASFNMGNSFIGLKMYDKAITAFEKAENSSPNNIYIDASFNKGLCFNVKNKTEKAILAFDKAIQDSENKYFPRAYLQLSKVYLQFNKGLAEKNAFIALKQDNRDYSIVLWIKNHFANHDTLPHYKARLRYLNLLLQKKVLNGYKIDSLERLLDLLKSNEKIKTNRDQYLSYILTIKDIELPLNLSYENRLRLAYLISYKNSRPWDTFYIIDEILDLNYELNILDYLFYLLSGYLIGEPISELKWFCNPNVSKELEEINPFNFIFSNLCTSVLHKAENEIFYDSYLIKLPNKELNIFRNIDIAPNLHPELIRILETFKFEVPYEVSFSEYELKGFLSQYISSFHYERNTLEKKDTDWNNFVRSIKEDPINVEDVIRNVRSVIKNGVEPTYINVLSHFASLYLDCENSEKRREYAILQAAVFLSYFFDFKKENRITKEFLNSVFDLSLSEFTSFITQGIFGVSWALGFIIKLFLSKRNKLKQIDIEQQFSILIEEINQIRSQ